MNNSWSRRDDAQIVECRRAPLEKFKSFIISFELNFLILDVGMFDSGDVNLDGVVDDQVDGAGRIDLIGISS